MIQNLISVIRDGWTLLLVTHSERVLNLSEFKGELGNNEPPWLLRSRRDCIGDPVADGRIIKASWEQDKTERPTPYGRDSRWLGVPFFSAVYCSI